MEDTDFKNLQRAGIVIGTLALLTIASLLCLFAIQILPLVTLQIQPPKLSNISKFEIIFSSIFLLGLFSLNKIPKIGLFGIKDVDSPSESYLKKKRRAKQTILPRLRIFLFALCLLIVVTK